MVGRWPICGPPTPPAEILPVRKKRKRKKKRPAPDPVTWAALATAVALATDARQPSGADVAVLLGDSSPESVIRAQALFTRAVIDILVPDAGARALRNIGLLAAGEASASRD
jgi:hypothetical protein